MGQLKLNAKSVGGKLVVTNTATGEVWDWADSIETTRDANGTACLGIWATKFEVDFTVGDPPPVTPPAA